MEVKQTLAASNRAKRGNLKSRGRPPLGDKTNVQLRTDQNNAMGRKLQKKSNVKKSETIEQDVENKNVSNDRKEMQPETRRSARGAKKQTEPDVAKLASNKRKEAPKNVEKTRSGTRNSKTRKVAEGPAEIVEKLTVETRNNARAESNVVKERKKGNSNKVPAVPEKANKTRNKRKLKSARVDVEIQEIPDKAKKTATENVRVAKKQTKILEFVTKTTGRSLRPKNKSKDVKLNADGKALPIYKQIRTSEENLAEDVYDFDSDSEQVTKPQKRKKRGTSIGYEKDMDVEIKKLEKKFKEPTRKKPTKIKKQITTISKKAIPTTSTKDIPTTSTKEIPTTSRKAIPKTSTKEIPSAIHQNSPVVMNDDPLPDYSEDDPEIRNVTSNVTSQNETFDFEEPIANSTMLNITRNVEGSPWRSNLNVIRNPHFLQFKNSFLPNYNQEMVMRSSWAESPAVEKRFPKSVEKAKSPKQASILNYIDGRDAEVIAVNSTLFDVHQFSPIKENRKRNSEIADKENSFEDKQQRRVDRAKRNILGPIVDNRQNSPGVADCFGFDDSVDVAEDRGDKPGRMDTFVEVIRRKNQVFNVSDFEGNNATVDESAADREVGLFEDYEPERTLEYSTIKQYVVKRKRQRRCRSPSPYTDSDNEDHQQRKKRNKRTKKEEEEADKWAAAFNSMCEEVEKFPLEID